MKIVDFASLYYRFIQTSVSLCKDDVSKIENFLKLISYVRDKVFSSRNHLLNSHLERVFPMENSDWRRVVISSYWRMHERNIVTLFYLRKKVYSDLKQSITWTGRDILDRAFDSGKGVLLLVPHVGDERGLHILLGMAGYPVDVITSDYSDMPKYVQECKLAIGRKWNNLHFPHENPRWMFRTIQSGRIVHFAPTAYGGKGGTWIHSFGTSVLVPSSPWKIWKRTECKIILGSCHHKPKMGFHLQFSEIPSPASKESFAESIGTATEQLANQCPAQYEWKNLLIRHRETNTMYRINEIPSDERVLEIAAIPKDSEPSLIVPLEDCKQIGKKLSSKNG